MAKRESLEHEVSEGSARSLPAPSLLVRLTDAVPSSGAKSVMARVGLEYRRTFSLPHRGSYTTPTLVNEIRLGDVIDTKALAPQAAGLWLRFQHSDGRTLVHSYQYLALPTGAVSSTYGDAMLTVPAGLPRGGGDVALEIDATEITSWPKEVQSLRTTIPNGMRLKVGFGFLELVPAPYSRPVRISILAETSDGTTTLYVGAHEAM